MQVLSDLPVISTHEHHQPDEFHKNLNLDRLFAKSYLSELDTKPGINTIERTRFLDVCRHNSYFVWLEKALQAIYSFPNPISLENWDQISLWISRGHQDSTHHLRILQENANYIRAIQDAYWDYGSNNNHSELFLPVMRTDMFVSSYHPETIDHDGNSPFSVYPIKDIKKLDEYLSFIEDLFTNWRNAGAIAMKSAIAYERSMRFDYSTRESAAEIFRKHPSEISPCQVKIYQDFMFEWFCQLAIKLEVPYQIHTGLAQLSGSDPLLFEPTIFRNPNLHFILFHAGYPWYGSIAGLAHNHSNISIDMCWAPLISTSGAIIALHQFIEIVQSNERIAWGSDTATSEEAFGALLAWRFVVAKVLSEKIDDGYINRVEATHLAQNFFYQNASRIYGIPV